MCVCVCVCVCVLLYSSKGENPRGVVANEPDCDIVVREFELLSHNCIHFWTNALGKA